MQQIGHAPPAGENLQPRRPADAVDFSRGAATPASWWMRAGSLAVSLFLLWSCAGLRKPAVADLTRVPPQEVSARVRQNFDRVTTLSGRGRLIVEMPRAQFTGHAKILVKKPDSLFIAAKAVLGVEVGFFFADSNRFASYSPIENTYYTGPVGQMHRLVLFEMELTYSQLLHAILGTAELRYDDSTRVKVVDNQYVFLRPWGKYFLAEKIDPGKFVVTEAIVTRPDGRIEVRQTFSRFRKIQGVWLPQIIRLYRPRTRERLTIYYEKVTLNRPLPRDEFHFKVPENARHIQLDEK